MQSRGPFRNRTTHSKKGIDRRVRERLEIELQKRGDDGLLEYLRDTVGGKEGARERGILALVDGILSRRLFKLIGRHTDRSLAKEIYRDHRAPDRRRSLEVDAAEFAGLDHAWQCLVWIPDPKMRLKAAEVFVDDGNKVAKLVERETSGRNRGTEIYADHKALWAVSVFVHPEVRERPDLCEALLKRLGERLGVGITPCF